MIEKSLNLHVDMIKNEMRVSAVLMVMLGLTLVFSPILFMFLYFIPMIGIIVCGYKVLHKIFGRSLYGEGAEIYQMLPISPRDMLIGKALAMVVWELILAIAFLLPTGILFFRENSFIDQTFFVQLIEKQVGSGLTPVQMGILAGLSFVGIMIIQFSYCMYMVLAQNLIHRFTGRLTVKIGDFPCIVFAALLMSVILLGGGYLVNLLALSGTSAFLFVIGKYLFLVATGIVLYFICRENLEKAYGR
ncbi:hypothetical protein ACPW7J_09860 [Ihubacter sp. rT4E-8]|uniref:hypothetical protein n=1 Tax=Ihubacter sp. rT4E-8 TaxID=3242369 RepID=UPI003CF2862A